MLFFRVLLSLLLLMLLFNDLIQCQHEFRNAIKAKKNRKIQDGKENIQYVKDKTHGAFNRTENRINQKQKNARRKMNAIKDVINS